MAIFRYEEIEKHGRLAKFFGVVEPIKGFIQNSENKNIIGYFSSVLMTGYDGKERRNITYHTQGDTVDFEGHEKKEIKMTHVEFEELYEKILNLDTENQRLNEQKEQIKAKILELIV